MSKTRKKKKTNNYKIDAPLQHRVLTLEELFLHGSPVNNTTLRGGKPTGKLSDECLQYIAYRSYQGWKNSQIADVLGIGAGAVKTQLRLLRDSATMFYEVKIVVRIEATDGRVNAKYLCRLHGEQFTLASDANNHCWITLFVEIDELGKVDYSL